MIRQTIKSFNDCASIKLNENRNAEKSRFSSLVKFHNCVIDERIEVTPMINIVLRWNLVKFVKYGYLDMSFSQI